MTFHPKTSIIENWTARASSMGKIIPPKGSMTDTIKSYLQEKYTELKWGVRKDITSKYFDKGTSCEQAAVDMLNKSIFPDKFVTTHKIKLHNEFVSGTPDLVVDDFVIDIKNAWDMFTFDKAKLTWEYEWQVKTYLWLTGKKQGFVFYALVNMPDHLLAEEEKRLFYSGKFISIESESFIKACEQLRSRYNYDNIDQVERFKIFAVSINEKDIETMEGWVLEARKHLKGLYDKDIKNRSMNFELMGGFSSLKQTIPS